MKIFKNKSILLMVLVSLLLIFTACTNDDKTSGDNGSDNGSNTETPDNNGDDVEPEPEPEADPDPVTISLIAPLGEEYLEGRFGAARDMMPDHVTVEFITGGGSVGALEELFAAGVYPDIIISDYPPVKELDADYPLDDLIEKHSFDLEQIDGSLNSFIRSLGADGEYVGFPDGTSFFGLYYNMDVFDALGIEYPDPEVPMTWDELMKLARQMTTQVGEKKYYGFTGGIGTALSQFAANRTDPETGEVLIDKDPAFRRYLDLYHEYYSIPGMLDEGISFGSEQNVAMHIASNNFIEWGLGWPEPGDVEHIEMAPLPVWEDMPTTRPANNAWAMMIAEYSEHKDEAFQLLANYMDPDVQIELAKTMILQTPLSDPEVLSYYGSENPIYKDKNVDSYFVGEAAEFTERQSPWNRYVDIGAAEARIREEDIDVNTLIRELVEESEVKIKDAMAQQ